MERLNLQIINPQTAIPPAVLSGFRAKALEFEARLRNLPEAMSDDCYPLVHSFGDGLYIRQITMPEHSLVVSKIHRYTHPFFVLSGKVSVLTDNGVKVIDAPFFGMTPSGTKRILWNHTEVVWVTVHRTGLKDVKAIEDEIIAKDFNALDSPEEIGKIAQFAEMMSREVKIL